MILTVSLPRNAYDVVIERGCLQRAGKLLKLDRKVLVVTDDGVPAEYAAAAASQCAQPSVITVPAGEQSKSFETLQLLLGRMLELDFDRGDCVLAVGGGVVGDLSGFAASMYMRGIDFYNIPTTLLSQVDSSIGGKTAVNFGGIKNTVGAIWQPKRVLVDPDLLKTLPARQISAGLAEALKESMTSDAELFRLFEADPMTQLEEIIAGSLKIKADVVAQDERETGLRRILNFGHTIGHGIESCQGLSGLYHGECVALGMIPMCATAVRARLLPVLRKLNLPVRTDLDPARIYEAMRHDKKAQEDGVLCVYVDEIGSCRVEKTPYAALFEKIGILSEVGDL